LASNVMQANPSTRGQHLTLGQVFRIHALLRPAEFPNCTLYPARCPPLVSDAPP
jgi:hypothetical protein